jgi:outer membrane protein assembly factor BamD (BamD/ComL family)
MHRATYRTGRILLAASLGLTLLAGCASPTPYEETQKKHFLSWTRPSRKNPADQLAHAQERLNAGDKNAARKAFKALVITWPGSAEAPGAQWEYAQLLEQAGKREDAFDAYQELLTKYGGAREYDQALESQFRLANATLSSRRGRFLFFGGLGAYEKAAGMFEKIAKNGPRWSRAPESQFLAGRAHELNDEFELGIAAFVICEQRYTDTPYAEQAALGRVRCWKKLADEAPNDQESLDQAWASTLLFLKRYPQSAEKASIEALRHDLLERRANMAYQRGLFYDRQHRADAALVNYREFLALFPDSARTPEVKQRVAALAHKPETAP